MLEIDQNSPEFALWQNVLHQANKDKAFFDSIGERKRTDFAGDFRSYKYFATWLMLHGYKPGMEVRRKNQLEPFTSKNCELVCGRKFARAAVRILGTRKVPANTDCPHCHGHATQSLLRAKNSGYYEIKRKLNSIITREDVASESLSHYTLRSTSMEFTELVIDAELSGRIDMMRQIYAI